MRLAIYVAITLSMLGHTLLRITTKPIRPFDWLMLAIEVSVLLLIAYVVGATVSHDCMRRG